MAKSITWDTNALCRQFIVKSIHVMVCWKKKGRALLFSRRVQPCYTWSCCFTANWSLVRWFQMCPQIHRMKTLWIVCVVLLFTGGNRLPPVVKLSTVSPKEWQDFSLIRLVTDEINSREHLKDNAAAAAVPHLWDRDALKTTRLLKQDLQPVINFIFNFQCHVLIW